MAELLIKERGMSTEEIIEFVVTTWAGAQHFWGHDLGYKVNLQLKWIKVYETDPPEYHPGTSMGTMLGIYCRHLKDFELKLDHMHIFSGVPSTDNAIGRCYQNGVCSETQRCGISYVWTAVNFWRPAHELGHNLGMHHPPNVECDHNLDYGNHYYCGRKMLDIFVRTKAADCLFEENVPMTKVADNLKNRPPLSRSPAGDTPENFCLRSFGHGYYYRRWQSDDTPDEICDKHTCVDLKPGPKFGRMEQSGYDQRGLYCDFGKICDGDYSCVPARTLYHEETIQIRKGGWSAWTAFSECSRTCGTGVKISERFCNNPVPLYSPQCTGDFFKAELCNTRPCPEDYDHRDHLILQRVNEGCKNLVEANVLVSWFFLPTGKLYGNGVMYSCELKCDTRGGKFVRYPKRHGLMPNGSPCESNGHCVNGYCMEFGCDGSTDNKIQDSCISLTQPVNTISKVFPAGSTTKGGRTTIAVIPGGSANIEFTADYSKMENVFLELWSKDGIAVIAPKVSSSKIWSTGGHPKFLADTFWEYNYDIQDLKSVGPTDQPVEVKVHQFGDISNADVSYQYEEHSQVGQCSGYCMNGGTWNAETCGCECTSGYSGIRCEIQCPPSHCWNGAKLNPRTCQCECPNTIYDGWDCYYCKPEFKGKLCQECSKSSCQNGGVFDETKCRCNCPNGFSGIQCEGICEDSATVDCSQRFMLGKCDSDAQDMEADCPFSCGMCKNEQGLQKSMTRWDIEIFTSDIEYAGTDGDVYVSIMSTDGQTSAKVPLDDSKNNYERNMLDIFPVVTHFPSIKSVNIFYPSTDHWHLDKVIMRNKDKDELYTFHYSQWLKSEGETPVVSTIPTEIPIRKCFDIYAHCSWYFTMDQCKTFEEVRRNCPVTCGLCAKDGVGEILKVVKWEILIYTSDIDWAGTYGDIIVTIYGWSNDVGVGEIINTDPITFGSIDRGKMVKSNFLSHFSVAQKISVQYTSTNWWHLNRIELKNIDSGKLYTFTYSEWFKSPQTITLLTDV